MLTRNRKRNKKVQIKFKTSFKKIKNRNKKNGLKKSKISKIGV